MQTVSPAFATETTAAKRDLITGVLISWLKTIDDTADFFTIGQSAIGGPDKIKSAGTGVLTYFDRYKFEDETDNVARWAVSRKLSQYPWGMIMAQADVSLLNATKRYLPAYDPIIGAYVDKPNRPIKISLGFNNEPIMQFVGFSDQPKATLVNRTVSITAFDALTYLNEYEIQNLGTLVDYTTDEIIEAILIEAGFSSTQYALEPSVQSPIGYIALAGKIAGPVLKQLVEAEMGLLFVDENGIIRFWNRQHLNNAGDPVFNLDYSNLRNIEWAVTPLINDVAVEAKPRFVAPNQKLWESASAIKILPGETKFVPADFRDDDGSLPVVSVDTPLYATLATTSYFIANDAEDGTGNDMQASVVLNSGSVAGDAYLMHFTNNAAVPVYLTNLVLYAAPAKVSHVESSRYYDQTSIDDYGRNPSGRGEPLKLANDFIQDVSTANSMAYIILSEYKDPRKRLKCSAFAMPQLQIGDFLTVTIEDTAEVLNMFVMGLSNKLDIGGNLTQELELEERVVKSYFTIGVSAIGGTDTIAP